MIASNLNLALSRTIIAAPTSYWKAKARHYTRCVCVPRLIGVIFNLLRIMVIIEVDIECLRFANSDQVG